MYRAEIGLSPYNILIVYGCFGMWNNPALHIPSQA